jgi:hypothetical protein
MKSKIFALFFILCLLCLFSLDQVLAGSTFDIGTVPGTPPIGDVNWIAWLDKNVGSGGYPSEVMTEEGTNSASGVNQGYQDFGDPPNPNWILQVENFGNEQNGDGVTIYLGGLGSSSGYIWNDTFNWDQIGSSTTDHGEATQVASDRPCPIMNQGSWDGNYKVINWSAPAGTYYIYRSTLPSGAENKASNGLYQYVATVTTTSDTGSYTDEIDIESWHIVVPADEMGAIDGCHSEESDPTAITLLTVVGRTDTRGKFLVFFGVIILIGAIFFLILKNRVQVG